MADTSREEQEMKRKSAQAVANAKDPIEKLRLRCLSRGANSIKGISRIFRIMDDDGSKSLDLTEFKKGIHDYGLEVNDTDAKAMFIQFDKDGSGTISFDEFLTALRPPMSQSRMKIIGMAFEKMDKTGDGVLTVADLKGVYNVKKHKKVMNGMWTEEQAYADFLKSFDSPDDPDGIVTREEFINYYSGVSASIDNDGYFDLMMRNAWKL